MPVEKHDDLVMQSLLLEEIGQSVIGLNTAWQVTYWNRASERLYGFPSAEVLGRRITELGIIAVPEVPGQEATRQEIADGIAAGRGWAGEFWMRHRTGREFTVYATLSPVRGIHSMPVAVVAVSRDITDRERSGATLRAVSAMVESCGDAIIGADMMGIITIWNAGATRMFGWSAGEAVGQSHRFLTDRTDEESRLVIAAQLASGAYVTGVEARSRHRDGSVVEVSLTLSPMYGSDGLQMGTSAIARDITELKRLRFAAAADLERLVAAQEMVHVGSVEHDIISDRWSHSDEYARIYGLAPGELVSRKQSLALVHPEDLELIQAARRALDSGTKRVEYEFRIIRADGKLRWMQSRAMMTHDPISGAPLRFLATVMDITDRKDAEQVLEWQARHDALTGLPNRYLLTDVLQGLLGRASRRVVVMFVDVDRFKLINDGIGHAAGDALLILLGERLRTAVRPNDTVGRFGGDEFVIVCENVGTRDAAAAAERIRTATRRPFEIDGRKIFLNVSVGIAVSGPGDTAESLMHGADTAMYEAKAAGGDGSMVYDSRTTGQAAGRLDLQSDLRVALERDELFLEYQPIIELDTERAVGLEALLRWQHGEHGLIMPDTFISIAEETGLIVPIGTWVLNKALAQVQRWRSTVPGAGNLSAAVNISARQLVAPDFPEIVHAAARAAGIDPAAVNLEITETVLMEQPELPLEILHRLHDLGVGLSIDDFGTGYSSLSYLKWMSARTLKIDRTFVEVLGSDPNGASIIELILGMARTLDLVVIAEGVETHDQLAELRRLGVRHAQGYLWSKPMPAGRVPDWLQSGTVPTEEPANGKPQTTAP
ncbi:diguanylate cyclase (GGDEF)-like protein/PAS domain S-box-containing protein [Arthrobacter pascens]|uniref:sensor domain-containing protein n=1 Tax=Arthrobacter pascens TaxID=1677 RepID=UPI002790E2E9|nr:EAL domain-containing protein [Arthrobacter pascens]MDQ0680919.1 diguanylate cyclase (GGDEF)-like protein/PAS domain S-box-containing protein [Arthrobacter pascens]